MKISILSLLIVILAIITVKCADLAGENNHAKYPGIDTCVDVCEKKSKEMCGDGEDCNVSVKTVNECIEKNCEQLKDQENQDSCLKKCVNEHGHAGIVFYNTCIDECVDSADKDELKALQKQQMEEDPEYKSLLDEWEKLLQDGEVDQEFLKEFLNDYEGGILKDILPTNIDKYGEELLKEGLKEEAEEEFITQKSISSDKKDDL